ncbi:MAG: aminodeoxychorismate synthase component I [Capsulimonadaceae bacterium]|nr:aminodeoxychorismate synthase component I [Capsulimonadaceae bacterium]
MQLIFDFVNDVGECERVCFTKPHALHVANSIRDVRGVLDAASEAVAQGFYTAGFVAYEAGPAFDPAIIAKPDPSFPLAWFAVFERPTAQRPSPSKNYRVGDWRPEIERGAYDEAVNVIRDQIAKGATYQTNLTMRLRAEFDGDPLAYYETLRAAHPAPYSAFLDTGRYAIVSLSPELFLRRDRNLLATEPMKGTIARGRWRAEDDANAAALRESAKDRAENVMIVDLMRSDLGRIAVPGSVRTPRLFDVWPLPTVWQMTSRVECEIDPATSLTELFDAAFPPGSVTGAPKPMTTGIIDRLEVSSRRVYCGAIGYASPGASAVFNVAIRTAIVDKERASVECGVGGGITWDSRADDEYREALAKASFLNRKPPDYRLLETLRLNEDGFFLLDRHLRRIEFSAGILGFDLAVDALRHSLQNHAMLARDFPRRVRLLVGPNGSVDVESSLLAPDPAIATVVLAARPIDVDDPLIFHKTDRRTIYEEHLADAGSVFDVLLWNAKGQVTEFTRGNFVARLDGHFVTPPLASGLLPGVYREELLSQGVLAEQEIGIEQLARCDELWFINSVRKWVRVATGAEASGG